MYKIRTAVYVPSVGGPPPAWLSHVPDRLVRDLLIGLDSILEADGTVCSPGHSRLLDLRYHTIQEWNARENWREKLSRPIGES
jgi:hypothetical protein